MHAWHLTCVLRAGSLWRVRRGRPRQAWTV